MVDVSDGYANNFLFPQALAVPATKEALAKMKAQEKRAARQVALADKAARKSVTELEGQTLTIQAKANDDGTLYAAVSERDVAKAAEALGVSIKPKQIQFTEPVKDVGEAEVVAVFAGGYEATFTIDVQPKG